MGDTEQNKLVNQEANRRDKWKWLYLTYLIKGKKRSIEHVRKYGMHDKLLDFLKQIYQ